MQTLTIADHKVESRSLHGWNGKGLQTVAWSADDDHMFVTGSTGSSWVLLSVDSRADAQVLYEVPKGQAWIFEPVASPDGRYLAFNKRLYDKNIVLLENF